MNRDLLESQWSQVRDILREKFSNLTDEDIRQINGRYDELVTKLVQKYGYTREEAEDRIRSWNFDRFTHPNREYSSDMSDNRVREESSPFKWLLAIGIPLLLLGSYFLMDRPAEVTNSPTITQEQTFTETTADRTISTGLRAALLSQTEQNLSATLQNVQITTHNGTVTLSGFVPTAETRDFIGTAAQNFAGVSNVINNIEVK